MLVFLVWLTARSFVVFRAQRAELAFARQLRFTTSGVHPSSTSPAPTLPFWPSVTTFSFRPSFFLSAYPLSLFLTYLSPSHTHMHACNDVCMKKTRVCVHVRVDVEICLCLTNTTVCSLIMSTTVLCSLSRCNATEFLTRRVSPLPRLGVQYRKLILPV